MKAEIKNKEKVFEPIELTITIDTKEELGELWARLQLKHFSVSTHGTTITYEYNTEKSSLVDLFDLINLKHKEVFK
jgi:hypothetical protein